MQSIDSSGLTGGAFWNFGDLGCRGIYWRKTNAEDAKEERRGRHGRIAASSFGGWVFIIGCQLPAASYEF